MSVTRPILDSNEQDLKKDLDEMYRLVNIALDKALLSLRENNIDTAAQVITEDDLINQLQHKIENNIPYLKLDWGEYVFNIEPK